MKKPIHSHWRNWPKLPNGEPVFQSPEEAVLFAHQVFEKLEVLSALRDFRSAVYLKLRAERNTHFPNYVHMLGLSLRAHFLTVCLVECGLINSEFSFVPLED